MTADEAKQKLINAGIVLEAQGLGDFTRGHVTIRDPDDPEKFFMKPHSFGLDEMTMDNIVTCDLEGEKLAGSGPRHSEGTARHTAIARGLSGRGRGRCGGA